MSNPARFLLSLLTHNFGWKLASLAIAFAIWILVASEPELSTFATARIEFKNLPKNLELSTEPVTSILLELRGPSGELSGLGDGTRRPAVVLDMSGMTPGEHTVAISTANVNIPRAVRIMRATPSEVRFDFDRPLEKTVPVHVRFAGEGKNGYSVTSLSVDPPDLRIIGPAHRVSAVRAVVTDPVDVSTATGFMKVAVNAYVQDPFVRFESSPQVTVSFSMRK